MEVSSLIHRDIESDRLNDRGEELDLQRIELEPSGSVIHRSLGDDQNLHSMNALEILIETVRILRYNFSSFMVIAALLICPVSAILLSNVLVDQLIVRRLTIRLMLMAQSSGLPLKPIIKWFLLHFSEMTVSAAYCFPLYITLLLLSKAAIVFAVDCIYLRKMVDAPNFFVTVRKIWRRLVSTYLWTCMVIIGCLVLFLVLLVAVCNMFSLVGLPSYLIIYPAMMVGLVFLILYAKVIMICNIAIVISVLEDVSGPEALLFSDVLLRGQTQVGLLMFLGSTIGMAFVQSLFEHRVKTLRYGDGSSMTWEGPLLVIMYSFVLLIDSMMSAVFYFTCRSSSPKTSEEQQCALAEDVSSGSMGIQ